MGLFVYASTADILQDAVSRIDFLQTQLYSLIWLEEGEILSLSSDGQMEMLLFNTSRLRNDSYALWDLPCRKLAYAGKAVSDVLLNTALNMGYEEEDIAILTAYGYCDDEIEELLQDSELFRAALQESYYDYAYHGGGY